MEIDCAALTDRGSRPSNQDAVLALANPGRPFAVFAVCDGVGGLARGAEASALAVRIIRERAAAYEGDDPVACVASAAIEAHEHIHLLGQGTPVATTLVAAVVTADWFDVVHAGDSRAYLFRESGLERLTVDHSWVMERVIAGELTEEEAALSPHRNIITRALGAAPDLSLARRGPQPAVRGDWLLLSSDGLHAVVPEAEIARALGSARDARSVCSDLIARANALGGPDNIAVVAARFGANSGPAPAR